MILVIDEDSDDEDKICYVNEVLGIRMLERTNKKTKQILLRIAKK